jgi:hypothetical protein
MPKRSAHWLSASGIRTWPPSDIAAKMRSASSMLSTSMLTEVVAWPSGFSIASAPMIMAPPASNWMLAMKGRIGSGMSGPMSPYVAVETISPPRALA